MVMHERDENTGTELSAASARPARPAQKLSLHSQICEPSGNAKGRVGFAGQGDADSRRRPQPYQWRIARCG
jgi:hypothetical protein